MRHIRAVVAATIALGLPAAFAHAAKPPKVAVICLGEDSAPIGRLQVDLEMALTNDVIELVPRPALVAAIGVPKVDPPPQYDKQTAENFLSQAERFYYEDDMARAKENVGYARDILAKGGRVPIGDRVYLRLWSAAVALAEGKQETAEKHARSAMVLDPAHVVDLDTFRPSVGELAEKMRAAVQADMVTIDIIGLPEAAQVRVDDRLVGAKFEVPRGNHYLSVGAPGYRYLERAFSWTADGRIRVSLPIAVAERQQMTNLVWDAVPSEKQTAILHSAATAVGAQIVVIAAARGMRGTELQGYVYAVERAKGAGSGRLSAGGTEPLAAWVLATIAHAQAGTGPFEAPALAPPALRTEQSMVWSSLQAGSVERTVSSAATCTDSTDMDPECFSYQLAGPGVRLAARFQRALWVGRTVIDAEFSGVSYDLSTIHVTDTGPVAPVGGREFTLRGGTRLRIGALFGYRFEFGRKTREFRPGIGLSAGAIVEGHLARDVETGGEPAAMFPTYARFSPALQLHGQVPIGRQVRVSAAGGVDVSFWAQLPERAYGDPVTAMPGYFWSGSVDVTLTRNWALALEYAGEIRSIEFKGIGIARFTNPLEDAQLDERAHTAGFALRRNF